MSELITRIELSRRLQISPAAVTKACKNQLRDACVGKRIDYTHRSVRDYINGRDIVQTPSMISAEMSRKEEPRTDKSSTNQVNWEGKIYEVPKDITHFADMPLRYIIDRFGTDQAFCDWLKATKDIEAINEKRLKNAETVGDLVSRDLIKVGIIEPIDSAHTKLLTDGAKTISVRAIAMHEGGSSSEDIEKYISEMMTSFIRPVKNKVSKLMKDVMK